LKACFRFYFSFGPKVDRVRLQDLEKNVEDMLAKSRILLLTPKTVILAKMVGPNA
jgi:hypothetical protein